MREEESSFSNRIHADDLAQACFIAGHHDSPGILYNVSDGHPTTMTDFFYRVADMLGIVWLRRRTRLPGRVVEE